MFVVFGAIIDAHDILQDSELLSGTISIGLLVFFTHNCLNCLLL